jgi:hypothetical protein
MHMALARGSWNQTGLMTRHLRRPRGKRFAFKRFCLSGLPDGFFGYLILGGPNVSSTRASAAVAMEGLTIPGSSPGFLAKPVGGRASVAHLWAP